MILRYCGVAALDAWLKRCAQANQASGASRTFVACEERKVIGYQALASGAVEIAAAPGRFRRNMPDPIPVALLARLAVDRKQQGSGLGRALFRDAAMRVAHAAGVIGIRGILVQSQQRRGVSISRSGSSSARPGDAHGHAGGHSQDSTMNDRADVIDVRSAADRRTHVHRPSDGRDGILELRLVGPPHVRHRCDSTAGDELLHGGLPIGCC